MSMLKYIDGIGEDVRWISADTVPYTINDGHTLRTGACFKLRSIITVYAEVCETFARPFDLSSNDTRWNVTLYIGSSSWFASKFDSSDAAMLAAVQLLSSCNLISDNNK